MPRGIGLLSSDMLGLFSNDVGRLDPSGGDIVFMGTSSGAL
jgi:hypothetical protein